MFAQEYPNLINDAKNKGIIINCSIEKDIDSLVYAGIMFNYDSIYNKITTSAFINKIDKNGIAKFKAVPFYNPSVNYEVLPVLLFQSENKFFLCSKYAIKKNNSEKQIGILINTFNSNLTLIDSNLIDVYTYLDTSNSFPLMYFECATNSHNNLVFTVLHNDKDNNFKNKIIEANLNGVIQKSISIDCVNTDTNNIPKNSSCLLTSLQELAINDSIKYIAFNGYLGGGIVYLDSNFIAKKVYQFPQSSVSDPIFSAYSNSQVVYSVKRNNEIFLVGIGDSLYTNDFIHYEHFPRLLLKKINSDGDVIKGVWLTDKFSYDVNQLLYANYTHENILKISNQNEIFVVFELDNGSTYLAMLDSNFSIKWERYLNGQNYFSSFTGVVTSNDKNKNYLFGHHCLNCTRQSGLFDIGGIIAPFNTNGVFSSINTTIDNPFNNNLSIFPNPSSGLLRICSASELFKSIVVSDITGLIVYEKKFINSQNDILIDLSELNTGLYFINAFSEDFKRVSKILLTR